MNYYSYVNQYPNQIVVTSKNKSLYIHYCYLLQSKREINKYIPFGIVRRKIDFFSGHQIGC